MSILRWKCGHTKKVRTWNNCIGGDISETPIKEKMTKLDKVA